MSTRRHSSFALLMARLADCPAFIIPMLVVGTLLGAVGEVALALRVGSGIAFPIAAIAGIVATHYCWGELEMYLVTAVSFLTPAVADPRLQPYLFCIPGALTGFMAIFAILDLMNRPNHEPAATDLKHEHDSQPQDVI